MIRSDQLVLVDGAALNEKEHNMTIWVTYLSPAGTTRQLAEVIAQEAERILQRARGNAVLLVRIGSRKR